jgi:hypothetical protein
MQLGGGSTFLFIVAQGTTTRGEARWWLGDDDYISVEQSTLARMAVSHVNVGHPCGPPSEVQVISLVSPTLSLIQS